MTIINPYLNFQGNCEEAFHLYQSVFGGEFHYISRYKDMPVQEGMPPMSEEMGNKIMHMSLPISEQIMLMGSDAGGDWAPNIVMGNNVTLSITVDSREEADRIFHALSQGGQVTMPMTQQFWGDYFGMWIDKFGINWMMSYNENFKMP